MHWPRRLARSPLRITGKIRHASAWCALPLFAVFLFSELLACPTSHAQCSELRAGDAIWVRLIQPVSSYSSKAGDRIRAMVIQSPVCDGNEILPEGTPIEGTIKKVKRVGLGLVHERASVDLRFDRLEPDGSSPIEIHTTLEEIDNARETVKRGVIQGIRATDTLQGHITSRLADLPTWNPYSDLALIAYRTAFPVFPEPEIFLPVGTDIRVEVSKSFVVPLLPAHAEIPSVISGPGSLDVDEILGSLPERTLTPSGEEADIVNVVLLGTKEQMNAAFHAAGWNSGARTTTRSVLREIHAFLAFKNYPEAPVSTQILNGKKPYVTWERGLDSYAKREHTRVWNYEDATHDPNVWVGAFTREMSAAFSLHHHQFIHHIDADLDSGREMMIRDLELTGCVEAVDTESRPARARLTLNATGDWMRTDGSIAVIQLKNCENPVFQFDTTNEHPTGPIRPRSRFVRYLRMQILSYRSDVIRGNVLYTAFDLTRLMLKARHHSKETEKMLLSATPPAAARGESANALAEESADHAPAGPQAPSQPCMEFDAIRCSQNDIPLNY